MTNNKCFDTLLTDYLEGELDESGMHELRAMLASDEVLACLAADAFQLHRLLGFIHQADTTDGFVEATMARLPVARERFVQNLMERVALRARPVISMQRGRDFWRWTAIGLSTAACVVILLSRFNTPKIEFPIATLILSENAAWNGGKSFQEGQRLAPGKLTLQRGTAVVRFDGGASVLLHKGCELQLESIGRARLRRGSVLVRAPEEAAGFVLTTPARELVDLGTEFSASVGDSGATEVRVLEGEVAIQEKASGGASPKILSAGESLRFSHSDAVASPGIEPVSPRFDEAIRAALAQNNGKPMHVFEGFDYLPGTYAPHELKSGIGWAGPWRLRTLSDGGNAYPGTTRTMKIDEEHHLETPAGKTFRLRPLATPLSMARDAINYVSMLYDEPPIAAGQASNQTRGQGMPAIGVGLGFRSSWNFSGENVTLRVNHIFRPIIETGAGQGFTSRVLYSPGQRMLMVAKIHSRRDGEDEVSLRIYTANEPLELVEPATWDVTSRGLRLNAELDLLMLQSSGSAPRDIIDLRIGPTWRSILPPEQLASNEHAISTDSRSRSKLPAYGLME